MSKIINRDHQITQDTIEDIYSSDPLIAMLLKEMDQPPDRAEQPLEWAIYRWGELRRKHTDKLGRINDRSFNEEGDKETAGWDDEEMQESGGLSDRFDSWLQGIPFTHNNHHSLVQEYYTGIRLLDKAGYWQDAPKAGVEDDFSRQINSLQNRYGNFFAQQGGTALSVWSQYLASNASERRRIRGGTNFAVKQVIDEMEKVRKAHRWKVLLNNPKLDRVVIKWFNNTPTYFGNRQYYWDLYGKFPSSVRKSPYR